MFINEFFNKEQGLTEAANPAQQAAIAIAKKKKKGVAEAGSFSYGKPPRKGSVADLAAKKRKEQERGQQPIEPKDQQVGVAKVTKGVAEGLNENAEQLSVGDPVIITGQGIEFEGKTGDIDSFGEGNRFVVVNLYNHGKHSFHSSDVSYNDYADQEDDLDEWIKNEQGVEETYGAKLHTEYKRNRFKQLEKIKQQQEKALGLGEAGCNMTYEGRYCSEHGMMECPGYSMTETSVQDKLHQQHQELRKQRGLPDPSYYKKLAAQKQAEIDALRAEIAADRAKSMKESLRPGERHHYEDDPKTGKRVYKGIRGDQYDAPKKTTGHEHDADRDRAAHRAHDRSMTESIESYMEELDRAGYGLQEEKVRLDPKCWKGKKIGSPKTKVKGGVRVNNCVPK